MEHQAWRLALADPPSAPVAEAPAVALVRALARRGVLVRVLPDRLRLEGSPTARAAVDPELRAQIAEHREALRTLLTTYPCVECHHYRFPAPGTRCYWCRQAAERRGAHDAARAVAPL